MVNHSVSKIYLGFFALGLILMGLGVFVSYGWIDALILNPRGKLLLDWPYYVPMAIGTSFFFMVPAIYILVRTYKKFRNNSQRDSN